MKDTIDQHLQKYGLRHFAEESDYYAWVRSVLSPGQIQKIQQHYDHMAAEPGSVRLHAIMEFFAKERIVPIMSSRGTDIIKESGLHVEAIINGRQAVLDVGCGIGFLTTWYGFSDPRRQVTGVDFSGETIEYAREYAKQLDIKNVQYHSMDITQAVPEGLFDAIVGTHCFEALPDLEKVAGDLVAHLDNDGILVSVTHHPHDHDIAESFEAAGLETLPTRYFDANLFGETARYSIVIGKK